MISSMAMFLFSWEVLGIAFWRSMKMPRLDFIKHTGQYQGTTCSSTYAGKKLTSPALNPSILDCHPKPELGWITKEPHPKPEQVEWQWTTATCTLKWWMYPSFQENKLPCHLTCHSGVWGHQWFFSLRDSTEEHLGSQVEALPNMGILTLCIDSTPTHVLCRNWISIDKESCMQSSWKLWQPCQY